MADWFSPDMDPDLHIETSEKGFTTDEIAVKWLHHFIKHSDAGPNAEWKLLLMDNHGSHETGEFVRLANLNHILPYPLLAHASHYMQPCDVGIFQPYKHWQNIKVNEAIAQLDVEYHLKSFLRDLSWVREQTFKKETIKSAFRKSGMYPPSPAECIKLFKSFTPPEAPTPALPVLPRTPTKAIHAESMIFELENKILEPLSSATKPKVQSLLKGTKEILTYSQLQEQELTIVQARRTEEMQRKVSKRKVVQKHGGLSLRYAEAKLAEKARKEQEKEKKKQVREFKKLLNIEKKMLHDQGVADRKAEKERKKRARELAQAGQEVPPELLIPILDREKEWIEARQIQAQAQLAQEAKEKEEEEEVSFIMDTEGDKSLVPAFNPLQQDFLAFPSSPPEGSQWWKEASIESVDKEEDQVDSDLEVWNEAMDYSWHNRK
jgi:hypothetical protein